MSGQGDAGPVDTGPVDTGLVDTGLVDTGLVDTGLVDMGASGGPAAAKATAAAASEDGRSIDDALAALDAGALEAFEFVINPDGSVTFVDFPPELLHIAMALNPDDPLVCERRALIAGPLTAERSGGD